MQEYRESLTRLVEPTVNPTPEEIQLRIDQGPVCHPDDKDCVSRWVEAFSDCD